MIFTRASVGSLPSATTRPRDEYADILEPGFTLHVSPYGVKTFYLYIKYMGKPMRIKIGRFPVLSVAQARELAQRQKTKMAIEKFEANTWMNKTSEKLSLSDLSEEYFKTRALKANTLRSYKMGINNYLADWKASPISAITKKKVIQKHADISKNSGHAMADNTMRTLRTLFEFYKDQYDFRGENPVKTLSTNRLWKTGIKNRRTRYINRKDLPAWFAFVDRLPNKTWRDYLLFVLFTGLRKSEAENLRWEDVDFEEQCFTIPDTKNGNPLTLPLNSFLNELLSKRYKQNKSGWVFPLEGNPRKPVNASGICRRIVPNSNFEFSIHDLRRTFSTLAESLDLSPLTIKRLMNHRPSGDVTEGYIIPNVDRLREPSEKIAQLITGIIESQRLQNITLKQQEDS
jgi:integrase